MRLSAGQLTALRNLARKQQGEAVDWIRIADARALADLGFADRGRAGWTISAAGLAALKTEPDRGDGGEGGSDHSVVRLSPPTGGPDKPQDDAGHD
jgi:hypothetical protein